MIRRFMLVSLTVFLTLYSNQMLAGSSVAQALAFNKITRYWCALEPG
jgi:hypothetical protein